MRVLLAVLLVGIAGCGGEETSPGDVAAPSSPAVTPVKAENAETGGPGALADKSPTHAADANPDAALEELGSRIRRNSKGQVADVDFPNNKQTSNAGRVHIKGLTRLHQLYLRGTQTTGAWLEASQGAGQPGGTQVTDAGTAELQQALPDCEIKK